jgi:glycosyltransferase involved in cell wall biosynthesis
MSFAPTVSVVIPALNEAANLPHVLPRIPADVHEVIVVDGHSVDDTVAVARALLPTVRVVEQPGRGKGDALRAGFTAARGDIIVALDADGSTRPEEIAAFVAALTDGTDFAKGSRFLRGGGTTDMPWYRRAGNLGFVALVRLLFGGAYTDLCYGYNALWRRIVPVLALDADGFEIETMMNVRALKAGLRVAEVPSFEDRRIAGTSNLRTIRDGWRVLCTILRERVTTLAEPAATVVSIGPAPELDGPLLISIPVEAGGEPSIAAWAEQLAISSEVPTAS